MKHYPRIIQEKAISHFLKLCKDGKHVQNTQNELLKLTREHLRDIGSDNLPNLSTLRRWLGLLI